jgi:amino acid adenylation domain-containing protein
MTSEFFSYLRSLDVKLWIEGDRLRYSAPSGVMTSELLKQLAERKPEIISFLNQVDQVVRATSQAILPCSREEPLPLSFAQARLWVFDRLNPDSAVYNVAGAVRLKGRLNLMALEQSFNEIIRRHEVLRTRFTILDGQPIQDIQANLQLQIPVIDLRKISGEKRENKAQRLATEEARQLFDLGTGPLLRLKVLKLGEDEHVLLVTTHHIISDGWSIGVLVQEFAQVYEAFANNKPSPLPPLPIQYADFAVEQRRWLQGRILENQLSHWKKRLGGRLPVLEMPTDRPRPVVQTFNGAKKTRLIPRSLSAALHELCQRQGVTLFMVLLAAFELLLYRYTGQDDLLVGTPIANRNRAEIEGLIGYFANTLVLRGDLSGDPSFLELVERVREEALGAYAHQDVPFERLIEELQPPRDVSRSALFQVAFVLQNTPSQELTLPELSLTATPVETETAKFDLTLEATEVKRGLALVLEYNTDLFDGSTVTRLLEHYQVLLRVIVANPDQAISKLSMLTEQERAILMKRGRSGASYDVRACLHELFEAQVMRTPDAMALVFEDTQVSYGELNRRANQLAHHLRALGVKPDTLVGIYLERSVELVIALLGVLKAGGAYVPLDPSYPTQRLAFMLEDANVTVILTQQDLMEKLPPIVSHEARVVCFETAGDRIATESEQNPTPAALPANLAYVIYTSGSTGKPKGTLVSHANVVRLFEATQAWFDFDESDVWTLFHSYAFDFSVWELWGALLYGGRLVIVSYLVSRSPEAFRGLLAREQVTILNQTPSAFRQLIRQEELLDGAPKLNLRLVIFGGEALELRSLRPWFKHYGDQQPRLVNMYGITETTVHVTYRPLSVNDIDTGKSYIGVPIPDLEVYLLDQYMQPVPLGIPGEIHVGGAGLARGYLDLPELTSQRFVPHPFSNKPGERLYKSGDLGRYLPNGDIEYLGRIDLQVKIRGFRIELGEIESVLGQHEGVQEASVIAREYDGEKRLTAYVVSRHDLNIDVTELRSFLKKKLPEYMIPSHFVALHGFPLTPHGKVDYQALPEPETTRPQLGEAYTAPRTATERALAEIWQETLGIERVGIHDNFFDLGGDSIRSIQVHGKARQRGLNFAIHQLFRHSTISEIAQEVTSEIPDSDYLGHVKTQAFSLISAEDRSRLPTDIEDAYPLAMLQAGMLFHSQYNPDSAVYHNITSMHLKAPFDEIKLRTALRQLVSRHPVLRTSFDLMAYSEPLQLVHQKVVVPLEVDDLRHLSFAERDEEIEVWFETEKRRTFDWTRAPLTRLHVHLRSEQTFQLSWTEHHAILDGWSVASMMTELFRIYFSSSSEIPLTLEPPPAASFRDFVALERKVISSEQNREFWREKLSDTTATILPRWPSGYRSTEVKQSSVQVPIPLDVSEALKKLSRTAGVPLKSVLLSAHLRVLRLLSGQQDATTGLIVNGRLEESDGDRVLGLFLNTAPLRLDMPGGAWLDLIKQTFAAEQEIMPFRRFPLAEMQRLKGGEPLFETTFNFINFHVYHNLRKLKSVEFLDAKVFADTNYALKATFSLDLITSDVQLELGYLISEFSEDQINSIGKYYSRTLSAMVDDPSASYESCSPLSSEERQRLLVEWNDTSSDYAHEACLHQLFEAQVERTPEKVAINFEEHMLTYGQLNRRANQLAHHLRAIGVGADVLVGLYAKRSLEIVIGALAILKAGAGYVPFDPQQPRERLEYMLEDTRVPVMLTQKALVKSLPRHSSQIICVDDWNEETTGESDLNPVSAVTARNLAYLIYTSGSTGRPKGILVEHQSLVNYVQGICHRMRLEAGLNFAMVQPLTVDASLTALYPPLVTGGCLHVISQEMSTNPQLLREYFNLHRIDCLKIAPTHLAALQNWVEPGELMPKDWLVVGGEASHQDWMAGLQASAPACHILNHYGPTEATVATLTYLFDSADEADGSVPSVPIGRPLPNTQAFLLDKHLQPAPVGVPGELYLGGDCLARGYLNRPDLTAENFIPHPYNETGGGRLYKTGDLARYLPDGNIVFLGRADDQVKIRGYRIEPGEVAAVLNQHPNVREAAVLIREGKLGEKTIVAYVVSEEQTILGATELRNFLKEKLPDYMVPSAFVMLDRLPRMPHGKLDPKALPEPEASVVERPESFTPPRDFLELQLAQIWESLLKVSPIGVRDNFFELGGHSILALHLMARIQNQFERSIPLAVLLERPTIEQMAVLLHGQDKSRITSPLVRIQPAGSKLPFFCVHPVGGNVWSYFALAQELGTNQPFYGLQAVNPNGRQEPLARIEAMASYYIEAIREVQSHGPYLLGGWSMGGVIALEMAQQLQQQHEQVSLVILMDSQLSEYDREGEELADEDTSLLVRFFLDLFALSGNELPVSLDELRPFKEEDLLNYFLEQATNLNVLPPHMEVAEVHRLLRVFKANRRALRRYVPASYQGKVVLFRASDGAPPLGNDSALRWRKVAEQLEVQAVPGDHYQIVTEPHVRTLAERMKVSFEEVQATIQNLP